MGVWRDSLLVPLRESARVANSRSDLLAKPVICARTSRGRRSIQITSVRSRGVVEPSAWRMEVRFRNSCRASEGRWSPKGILRRSRIFCAFSSGVGSQWRMTSVLSSSYGTASVPLEISQRDKREKVSGGRAPITKSAFLAGAVMALRRNRASTRRNQGAASAGVKAGRVTFGVAAAVVERSPAGLEASEVLASAGMARRGSSELKGHQCREVQRQVQVKSMTVNSRVIYS